MKRLFAVLLTIGMMGSVAYAHNGMDHVMGTVASLTDNSITVTTHDGKSQTVAVDGNTKYAGKDVSMAMTMKDIKVGDHVVIHATKKGDQLTAQSVKIGTGMKGKGMHGKGMQDDGMDGMKMDDKASPEHQ